MVDVRVGRASLLERICRASGRAALIPEHVLNPEGVSDRQRRRSSLNDMTPLAARSPSPWPLRELGRDVTVYPEGRRSGSSPGSPADGDLQVGDVIVGANGEKIRHGRAPAAFEDVEPGESVELTVEREDKPVELVVGTRAAEDDPERAVMGVQVENAEDFDFPLDIEIDAGGIGGPSAGLAFALDIVDELGDEDLDRGRTVVATGELDLDGNVHAIGGVKQKAIGARDAGRGHLPRPRRQLRGGAGTPSTGLRVVAVSTFDEALAALREE